MSKKEEKGYSVSFEKSESNGVVTYTSKDNPLEEKRVEIFGKENMEKFNKEVEAYNNAVLSEIKKISVNEITENRVNDLKFEYHSSNGPVETLFTVNKDGDKFSSINTTSRVKTTLDKTTLESRVSDIGDEIFELLNDVK